MSKLKLLSIAVFGLLVINLAIVGFLFLHQPSRQPGERPPMDKEVPRQVIIDMLQLDKSQTAVYDKLITEHQVAIRALEDSVGMMKNNLYKTLNNESFAGKDSMIHRLVELQEQIELVNFDHFVALKQLCRPDQLDNYNKLTIELARFFANKKDALPLQERR